MQFEPDLEIYKEGNIEIIKTNILSKIHDTYFKNETSRMLTRFFFDLAQWPSFDPKWPSFKRPRNHQGKYFEQDSWWLFK